MREKNSSNLNTSGKEGVAVKSPSQAKNVTKYTSRSGHLTLKDNLVRHSN
jgi:ATP-dependent RNA circularization protein (DNA/RNA ligase family)